MSRVLLRSVASTALVRRIVELPELPRAVRAMPPADFAALVRRIGVEDAGELVALATPEQLVVAFDEELFTSERPGERESLDARRFGTWVEVLLEADEAHAARRVASLGEDFLAHALSASVLVFDEEALRHALDVDAEDAEAADKALEAALSEELDGYVLVAREPESWDAILALVLALDREDRAFLERTLDRAVRASSGYLEDPGELVEVLTAAESLAEDVEAEREARRAKVGYVEPRAAKAFLRLARAGEAPDERDAGTKAYLRDLERGTPAPARGDPDPALAALVEAARDSAEPGEEGPAVASRGPTALGLAMQWLAREAPAIADERTEELAYLTNVLVAAADGRDGRMRPFEAAASVMAMVELGARLAEAESPTSSAAPPAHDAAARGLAIGAVSAEVVRIAGVLRARACDLLFRRASAALALRSKTFTARALLRDGEELAAALGELGLGSGRRRRAAGPGTPAPSRSARSGRKPGPRGR
jgi:hypothetical protein